MPTRRTVLKHGGYAILASAVPFMMRSARAATAFDFYISPTGNDSNPGTLASPWAITSLSPLKQNASNVNNWNQIAGKKIGLIAGTYGVYDLWQGATYDTPALSIPGGSSASAMTYIASCDSSGDYSARAAKITASPSGTPGGGLPGSSGNSIAIIGQGYNYANGNVHFDGIVVSDSNGYCFTLYGGGGGNFIVENCELYNVSGSEGNNPAALIQYHCTGNQIRNNRIHDCQLTGAGNHNIAGIFSFGCTGNIYTYNTIYNCNSCIYDKDSGNGGHTYAYNYLECNGSNPQNCVTNSGGGQAGQTRTVHHNVMVAAGGSNIGILLGINDSGPNYYTPNENMVFYNNTCYVLGGGNFQLGLMWQSPGIGSVKHYNNIWVSGNPGYGTVSFNPVLGAVAISNYNCFAGGSSSNLSIGTGGMPSKNFALALWRTAMTQDVNSISPSSSSGIFSSPGGAQNPAGYKLASGSVCRGTGRTGGSGSGSACDMGAWGFDPALGTVPTQIGASLTATAATRVPAAPVLYSIS